MPASVTVYNLSDIFPQDTVLIQSTRHSVLISVMHRVLHNILYSTLKSAIYQKIGRNPPPALKQYLIRFRETFDLPFITVLKIAPGNRLPALILDILRKYTRLRSGITKYPTVSWTIRWRPRQSRTRADLRRKDTSQWQYLGKRTA